MTEKVSFGSRKQAFYELSPMYKSPFYLDGRKWKSLMHYLVINSFRDIIHLEILHHINSMDELMLTATRLGNGHIEFEMIEKIDFLRAIYESFRQNKHRTMVLISTGSAELVYNGPKSYLTEDNRYGKILMNLRFKLAEDESWQKCR